MIRVIIVDDSALVRKVLSEELSKHDDIEVVGTASDPYIARDKITALRPDVITLDIEMPKMDGLSFLSKLMKHHPMPVIIVSSVAVKNSREAIMALALGAVEIVPKPGTVYSVPDVHRHLVRAVRAAAASRITGPRGVIELQPPDDSPKRPHNVPPRQRKGLIAIGASTGGTVAIEAILRELPATSPGILIVQHIPRHFTAGLAERLDRVCPMKVREAENGDRIEPGVALVAPGDQHMLIESGDAGYTVRVKDGPTVYHQRPSVEVLFQSVAECAGKNAIGILLTGMGADGARGLLEMRKSGAYTIAQDEATCVVYGMPREAAALGAAVDILPLSSISRSILRHLSTAERKAA